MLTLRVDYNVDDDKFEFCTNVKAKQLKDVVEVLLRSQIGLGRDDRDANPVDVYTINCTVDISRDAIRIKSNCGNLSLETGLLLEFYGRLGDDGVLK
jgi:hypothetical protein